MLNFLFILNIIKFFSQTYSLIFSVFSIVFDLTFSTVTNFHKMVCNVIFWIHSHQNSINFDTRGFVLSIDFTWNTKIDNLEVFFFVKTFTDKVVLFVWNALNSSYKNLSHPLHWLLLDVSWWTACWLCKLPYWHFPVRLLFQ